MNRQYFWPFKDSRVPFSLSVPQVSALVNVGVNKTALEISVPSRIMNYGSPILERENASPLGAHRASHIPRAPSLPFRFLMSYVNMTARRVRATTNADAQIHSWFRDTVTFWTRLVSRRYDTILWDVHLVEKLWHSCVRFLLGRVIQSALAKRMHACTRIL